MSDDTVERCGPITNLQENLAGSTMVFVPLVKVVCRKCGAAL